MIRAKRPSSKVTDPADLVVTDDLRKWAHDKHGAMYLPDVYLTEFQDKAKARGVRYADCAQALRNYINWESPAGKYYKADYWERQIRKARKLEGQPARLSLPAVRVAGQYVNAQGKPTAEPPIVARSSGDVAKAAIAAMRAKTA